MNIKINYIAYSILLLALIITSCEKDEVLPENIYDKELSFPDSSSTHPKNTQYQKILDDFIHTGAVGYSLMIRDQYGTWLGAEGYADIASNIKLQPAHQFQIASISKIFTAAAIFAYADDGVLSIEDPVNKWIDKSITDKIANANDCKIKHLLSHRSGIPDYYTTKFTMDQYNEKDLELTDHDILEYIYGKKAVFDVDKTYEYSNTNYLLLGLILEKASGLSLKEVYENKIFNPLNLKSAYYGVGKNKSPEGVVKGYYSPYSNDKYVEGKYLYNDEIGIGGDGGIAINAQDLGKFMDELMAGNVISQNSLNAMLNWFGVPIYSDDQEEVKNGYGMEYFKTDYGIAYGHTGYISSFVSYCLYYPEKNITIVGLKNFESGSYEAYEEMVDFEEKLFDLIFE